MPNYVVDTSVVADILVSGVYTAQAERLMLSVNGAIKLIVPGFCLVECTNVLWKRVRSRDITQAEAETLADDPLSLPLSIASVDTLFRRALQIGLAHQLAIYDSIYIALAENTAIRSLLRTRGRKPQRKPSVLPSNRSPISNAISYPEKDKTTWQTLI